MRPSRGLARRRRGPRGRRRYRILDVLHGGLQVGYDVSRLLVAGSELMPQISGDLLLPGSELFQIDGHLPLVGSELFLVPGQLLEVLSDGGEIAAHRLQLLLHLVSGSAGRWPRRWQFPYGPLGRWARLLDGFVGFSRQEFRGGLQALLSRPAGYFLLCRVTNRGLPGQRADNTDAYRHQEDGHAVQGSPDERGPARAREFLRIGHAQGGFPTMQRESTAQSAAHVDGIERNWRRKRSSHP